MKRARLILPQKYIFALQEVLGIRLDDETVKTREGKRTLETYVGGVAELQSGLTKERDEFLDRRYLSDPALRNAYLLYYTTTNVLKPLLPLEELFLHMQPNATLNVLDLGCGTGAASLGLLHFLERCGFNGTVNLHIVDAVASNLEHASKMIGVYAKGMPFTATCIWYQQDIEHRQLTADKQFDLILMMNTINELPDVGDRQLLEHLASCLTAEGSLLFIEPAARTASRRLLRVRDEAVQAGYTVFAPCTRQSYCPALREEANWCHTEVEWERPSFIRHIDDRIGTLRLSIKYSYITLNKHGDSLQQRLKTGELSRVVSNVFSEKGRVRLFLCNGSGRHQYILNKRDLTDTNRAFASCERYDLVQITGFELREHDVKLTKASNLNIVLPKSGARY